MHMYLWVDRRGTLKFAYPDLESPLELTKPCLLDWISDGGMSPGEVGQALGISRERVGQVERAALKQFKNGFAF